MLHFVLAAPSGALITGQSIERDLNSNFYFISLLIYRKETSLETGREYKEKGIFNEKSTNGRSCFG